MRERRILDGEWAFQFADVPQDTPTDDQWGRITVPLVWQVQFEHLRSATGTGWYQRELDVPPGWASGRVILHIGAAYHITSVWLNGVLVGEHNDGYLPFALDLTPHLAWDGPNILLIRVVSPSDDETLYPDYPFSQIPHGKQSWYGHLGGIWQSVWMEHRPRTHIHHAALHTDLETGSVRAEVTLNADGEGLRCQLTVDDISEAAPITGTQASPQLTVDNPRPWSPDDPQLYTARIRLLADDGTVLDEITRQIGFRRIETRDGQIYLNGQPFYLRGALDQDYYPGTITTPPSVAFIEDQLHKARAMGLNCLRMHIKLADPRYYEAADRIGVLLWVDYPNWGHITERTQAHVKASLSRMLARDGHHPSIGIWTLINEDWGTDLVGDADHRAWVRDLYHWMKAADPTRLVVDNSACIPNFHVESDLNDYHYYAAMPDNIAGWDAFVRDFASGNFPTYSPHGDAVQHGDEPRIVSEFGNWGLPDLNRLHDDDGSEPWWTETGSEWGDGAIYPHGMQHRFRLWHLDKAFGSWEAFIAASQWSQFGALAHEIDTMRLEPRISGYVITEFTDLHWEANGLLDFHRQPKAYFDAMPSINGETTLILRPMRPVCWAGETLTFTVTVSHHGAAPLTDMHLTASVEGRTILDTRLPRIAAHDAPTVDIQWQAPVVVPDLTDYPITLRLTTAEGVRIAERIVPVSVFTPRAPAHTIWTPSERLRAWVDPLGYPIADNPGTSDVIVADELTPALIDQIRSGCRALLLAESEAAIPSERGDPNTIAAYFPYTRVIARQHTAWEGNWASTLAWVHLPNFGDTAQVLDARFQEVVPRHVLSGFKPLDFESHVFAGLFAGWVQRPMALAARRRYGRGQLMLSTFQLTTANPANPVMQTLFAGLLDKTVE